MPSLLRLLNQTEKGEAAPHIGKRFCLMPHYCARGAQDRAFLFVALRLQRFSALVPLQRTAAALLANGLRCST